MFFFSFFSFNSSCLIFSSCELGCPAAQKVKASQIKELVPFLYQTFRTTQHKNHLLNDKKNYFINSNGLKDKRPLITICFFCFLTKHLGTDLYAKLCVLFVLWSEIPRPNQSPIYVVRSVHFQPNRRPNWKVSRLRKGKILVLLVLFNLFHCQKREGFQRIGALFRKPVTLRLNSVDFGDGGGGKIDAAGAAAVVGSEGTDRKMDMSTSQKLTLGYAAIVGVGGIMGYLKRGSQKSLVAGGISASALYYVYTELPTRPVLASSLGLGISSMFLGVMGYRFKKSGKVFPAGIVSVMSLVMAGGYLHGILHTAH